MHPPSLSERRSPARRPMSVQLPEDGDVPLRAWLQAHGCATLSRADELPGVHVTEKPDARGGSMGGAVDA